MRSVATRILAALCALIAGVTLASAEVALGAAPPAAPPVPLQQAILAGGCFWCMESDLKAVHGVVSVDPGYTGGRMANPSYQDVLTERTGHYEAVRVRFDPRQITYRQLIDRYWNLVDPTDDKGQFCDRGPSYRPAIFVDGPNQRRAAEESLQAAMKRIKTGRIVTPILPAGPFYRAEPYHRDFANKNRVGYEMYRIGCGRDARLTELWGRAG
jgi:peptide-methionine (S)-S-oxide reductase